MANKGRKTFDELLCFFFRIFLDTDFLKRHWKRKVEKERERNVRAGSKKRKIAGGGGGEEV